MNTKIDVSNMRQVIIDSALQLPEGLELAKNITVEGNFTNIIICGMGGSTLPALLIETLHIKPALPIYIHQSYGLPVQADQNSLIICISYSGNTEETVSSLQEAVQKKLTTIAMATGGEIASIAKKNNIPLVTIPSGIQPRCATGYIFSALVQILINAKVFPDISPEILAAAKQLQEAAPSLKKEGKTLAKKLHKKIPVIYASKNFEALSHIWKIKFNENSKIPAFWNFFPELNHNEMVGYTKIKNSKLKIQNFHVLMLQDANDHPRIIKRMALTANLIKKSGAKTQTINFQEGSIVFKIFSCLLLGDWTSYYLAMEYGIDPTPVKIVEEFKGMMVK
ncbi:MAG: bifunctional phosphoglucose/phosphomannose isomerase [Candidatus Staskawiczbacteria bacterium RIFCSPHIGHO2_02_FULL_42_22]|uniref:Bifunctional phosphoglucose/phosphomannose isomerase n=1 Tax=Candidatus Staskawiczbacteria bacterium RIFCSPHIGHO2_02_FULL_42_22 TaxID=1802207 RepID=A0A1G2I1Q5_9BACT|nr:MAG: bifunctional phosphoglucose/phosphomannose isomerase [Candidatus Staskawiczbacteria bacterium RIFCSPHIGHO2_02_FULL_42_22]